MGSARGPVLAAALLAWGAAPARAGDPAGPAAAPASAREASGGDAYLGRLAAAVTERLDALAAGHAPRLVPPVPVQVAWKPARLGSLDLGAPLAALAAADLDGDGKAELYAVTSREVIAIAIRAGKAAELGRVAFAGPPAAPQPRDAVGTAVLEGGELVAASSAWTNELRVDVAGQEARRARGRPRLPRLPRRALRPGSRPQLLHRRRRPVLRRPLPRRPRRSRRLPPARARAARAHRQARRDDREVRGRRQAVPPRGVVRAGRRRRRVRDRRRRPRRHARGDRLRRRRARRSRLRQGRVGRRARREALFKKPFQAGVAAVAAIDTDGDGADEVIAAVRLAGATRVDLWRLP